MERSPAGRHEESDDCIVPRKPRTKPRDIGGGDGGGKAVGRRKGTSLRMSRTQSRNWHVTEAARPRIGAAWAAQAPMADHVRPSTGARCVSSARRDLCGGERGNPPPTATIRRSLNLVKWKVEADPFWTFKAVVVKVSFQIELRPFAVSLSGNSS